MLNETWSAGNGPFADNVAGLITAETMRQFASAIRDEGVTSEWFQTTSGTISEATYTTDSLNTTVDMWFTAVGGVTEAHSASWSTGATDDSGSSAAIWELADSGNFLLMASFIDPTNGTPNLELQGLQPDVTISPIISIGTISSVLTGNWETYTVGAGRLGTGTTTVNLSGEVTFPMFNSHRFVRLGIRFQPDDDDYVAADGSLAVDTNDIAAIVTARPLAATV